jgi:hypothetical protein
MYNLEQELVCQFVNMLAESEDSPWGTVKTLTEFDYLRGRVDVVALTEDGEILAFEAKLTRWRDALHQAYRNTCFAHRSYVVVPQDSVQVALRNRYEFDRRSIGLCYLSADGLTIALEAQRTVPLQSWLSDIAVQSISEGGESG